MSRILSIGRDHHLMTVRSMLLRDFGHSVKEAHSVEESLLFLDNSDIDLLLICHTMTPAEHITLIAEAQGRGKIPVICLIAREGDSYPNCINAANSPDSLLEAINSLGLTKSRPRAGQNL